MEINALPKGSIYLDTNIFIYALEDYPKYHDKIIALFLWLEKNATRIITSELTLAECLVKPYQNQDELSISRYEEYIQYSDFIETKPVTLHILKNSAKYRAQNKIKLPDAIHMVTAIENNCDVIITNDNGIKSSAGLEVVIFDNLKI